MNREAIGKEYPPVTYEVGREKIREYARATYMDNPLYLDPQVAKGSKYGTIVAPPTFAAVYCGGLFNMILLDPELGLDLSLVVHGEQEFRFGKVVRSGDLITTRARIKDMFTETNRAGVKNEFVVISTVSKNQNGELVCEGTGTLVQRGQPGE